MTTPPPTQQLPPPPLGGRATPPPLPRRPAPPPRLQARHVVLITVIFLLCFVAISVVRLFCLGSDTAALRNGVMSASSVGWEPKIALKIGWPTMGAVRSVAGLFPLPPEARAALDGVRGAEVGIYEAHGGLACARPAAIFPAADKAMSGRGWQRLVGACQKDKVVAVYVPRRGFSARGAQCCVMVLDGHRLVVAGAKTKPEALLQLLEMQNRPGR